MYEWYTDKCLSLFVKEEKTDFPIKIFYINHDYFNYENNIISISPISHHFIDINKTNSNEAKSYKREERKVIERKFPLGPV